MPVLEWSCARRSLSFLVLLGAATVLGRSAVAQATPRGSNPRGTPSPSSSSASGAGSPTGMPLNSSVGNGTLVDETLSSGLADHSVHFYYIAAPGAAAVDGRHMVVLKQRISVALDGVTLSHALEVIAAKAGLRVTYGTRDANTGPFDADVTLHADNITVEAALTDVLADAGLDVQLSNGVMALVPQGAQGGAGVRQRQGFGRLVGRVLDTATTLPVGQAQIRLDELNTGALTGNDGRFLFPRVPIGHYHLTVRRVGFMAKTVAVTVHEDSTDNVTVQLVTAPTRLDEVVSTANGDQRRVTIGNDIASINVDSLAPTTPVMDITDLISARAPGVEVLESNGEVGNGASLRIRGQTSLVLAGDPIIIVDGVRMDNTAGGSANPFLGGIPSPSRINDIDFNDVESIDVLKGPSAATEYGTDAANGVIVIKTKHAHSAGPPKWNISAEQAWSQVGTGLPETYYAYGHTTGPNPRATQCPMVPNSDNVGVSWSNGTCAVDSIVKFNALNNGNTTIFGTGTREKVDLSVQGGSDAARYYIGGGLTNETGPLHLPKVFEGSADSIGLPRSLWDPNSQNQRSARANTVVKVSPQLDVTASAAYMTNYMQAPSSPSLYETAYTVAPQNTPAGNYGWGPELLDTPIYEYGNVVTQSTQRFTGSLTFNWNPWSWFQAHLTGGLDHESVLNTGETYPQVAALAPSEITAQLSNQNGTNDVYSIDFRTAAIASLSHDVKSTTSAGLQMVENRSQYTYAQGVITASSPTLNGLTNALTYQTGGPTATLGGYIEEQLALWDRLYLTGAVRIDDGSSFGTSYPAVVYPKASVSWLALPTEAATSLRLRGAYGQSGVQPPPGSAQTLYSNQPCYLNSAVTTCPNLLNAANENLQPERTSEFEGGADAGFLHGRINVGVTGYYKETDNALVATGTGWELGSANSYENIGEVTNSGVEATISATLIANRNVTWDVQLNGSTNHNDLVRLAPGISSQTLYGDHAVFRFTPGTPLYGYAAEKEHWNGQTQNGVVTAQDVTVDDSLSYAGPSQPTRMASFSSHLSLFHGVLTFGTLFDYRGGYRLLCTTCFHSATYDQSDYASNFANAPIWEQVRDVATNIAYTKGLDGYAPSAGFYEDASFVRWRELSVTYALPDRWARRIGMKNLSLTGAVRNVLLFTPYTGGDPEVTSSEGDNYSVQPTTGTNVLNHDVREGAQGVPLSRYFVLRLNAGF
jgi:TonB-linked SusC/RagA family outer membrane protein